MNAKEYELIAGWLYDTGATLHVRTGEWLAAVDELVATLEATYPKTFDRSKFLKSCGLGEV